jgi:hypothetical protein
MQRPAWGVALHEGGNAVCVWLQCTGIASILWDLLESADSGRESLTETRRTALIDT